ncbi:MAG TPA: NAD(P)/FAD-dependent oxidoreductase, partial [Nitrospirota bacterium]|nr:NAD(P)/FAD-dependent oxidoreductase [Nitrospirota bacterium]
ERRETFGRETSSRNSEVIHSGIYYPAGSLKAALCVEGARLLYRFCEENSVPFKRLGKLIVASDEDEMPALEALYGNGGLNGVQGLEMMGKADVARMEPNVTAHSAIYSPRTGIFDTHGYMSVLYASASASGALFAFGGELRGIRKEDGGYVLSVGDEGYSFFSRAVVNSAGLASDKVAGMAGVDVDAAGYRLAYCKGSYFSYSARPPVKMLVYPVPHEGLTGLGVHATPDMAGRLRFGPDVEYVDELDYRVDPEKSDVFHDGARKIIKGLEKAAFMPDMAGIRPKIKGEGFKDFVIRHEADRGFQGLINLIGIESPGLTASLAIAGHVGKIVSGIL